MEVKTKATIEKAPVFNKSEYPWVGINRYGDIILFESPILSIMLRRGENSNWVVDRTLQEVFVNDRASFEPYNGKIEIKITQKPKE